MEALALMESIATHVHACHHFMESSAKVCKTDNFLTLGLTRRYIMLAGDLINSWLSQAGRNCLVCENTPNFSFGTTGIESIQWPITSYTWSTCDLKLFLPVFMPYVNFFDSNKTKHQKSFDLLKVLNASCK